MGNSFSSADPQAQPLRSAGVMSAPVCSAANVTCPSSHRESCAMQCFAYGGKQMKKQQQEWLAAGHRFVVIHRGVQLGGVKQIFLDIVKWFTSELMHSGILHVRTMKVYHFEGYDSRTATWKKSDFSEFHMNKHVYWEEYGQGGQDGCVVDRSKHPKIDDPARPQCSCRECICERIKWLLRCTIKATGKYNFVHNNCQRWAYWAYYGKLVPAQAQTLLPLLRA